MFRKIIISLVVCAALVLVMATFASAQGASQVSYQDAIPTPTAVVPLQSDLPLANSQTGNCPMMSGSGMTGSGGMAGMNMSGMNMNGMSGMPMDQMSGMQGQGMSGMTGMSGMNMTGMNGGIPWYNNPWLMLGWILLAVAVIGISVGVVLGFRWFRNSKAAPTVIAS